MPTVQAMRRQILGLMTSSESLTEARASELLELFEIATADEIDETRPLMERVARHVAETKGKG